MMRAVGTASRHHWSLSDIPFDRIDLSLVRGREDLLFLLAGSSFIEFASDIYAGNLAAYCHDEPEIRSWLTESWEKEELMHGLALRSYVQHAWPEFPWQAAYDSFFAEYSQACKVEFYQPTPGLEMVARCMVEIGTSTCYQAMRDLAEEPVLKRLLEKIRSDEVRHYKYFLRYFGHYDRGENKPLLRILGVLCGRLSEARHSDMETGLWHAFVHVHATERRSGRRFSQMRRRITRLIRMHYPATQGMRMMLAPLRLPNFVSMLIRPLIAPLAVVARAALLR